MEKAGSQELSFSQLTALLICTAHYWQSNWNFPGSLELLAALEVVDFQGDFHHLIFFSMHRTGHLHVCCVNDYAMVLMSTFQ